jgi:hypothetical protein
MFRYSSTNGRYSVNFDMGWGGLHQDGQSDFIFGLHRRNEKLLHSIDLKTLLFELGMGSGTKINRI